MYHAVLNIVCFETFSKKRKENELHRKYTFSGGPAGNQSPPTILQTKLIWWFYFIYYNWVHSFTYRFFEFLNNKHLRRKWFFSSKNRIFCLFFVLHVFTGKRSNIKKMPYDCLGNSISYKMIPVSASKVKNCGRICIFSGQKCTFQEGRKTHQNIINCNYVPNINVNNNINCWYVVLILLHWWNKIK